MDLWAGMSFFPRKSYLRALRIDCPFIAFLHFLGGLKNGKRSTQGSVDHRVETDNKPHFVTFSITSDCFETVGAFEVCDNRLRRNVRDEPVDHLLFGFLENGWVSRQSTGPAEACSGPRGVAVRSVSTVCSQWLPQACWLELGACDETFYRHVRDFLHFNLVVFTSALDAPDEVFGERTVPCNNDDVVVEPTVLVNGERTQGLGHHRSTEKAKAASDNSPEFFITMPEPFCTRHNLSGCRLEAKNW